MLEILEVFRKVHEPLTAQQIRRHLGYPLSSTSVLLRFMTSQGYLIVDRARRAYFPTARVAALGSWIHDSAVINPALTSVARAVRKASTETVSLSLIAGHEIEITYIQLAKHQISLSIQVGARIPICQSAVGFGWLITKEAEEVRRICEWHNNVVGKSQQVQVTPFMAMIRKFKDKGYVLTPTPLFPGFATLSLPLWDSVHEQVAVMAISGLKQNIFSQEARLMAMIHQTAGEFILTV